MPQHVGMVVSGGNWAPFRNRRERFSATSAVLRSWWRRGQAPAGSGGWASEGSSQTPPSTTQASQAEVGFAEEAPPPAAGREVLGSLPDGVALDVGFAALSIGMGSEDRPSILSIEARDGSVTEEGIGALLQMMDSVLGLAEFSSSYLFTCDLRALTWPQPDMIVSIRHWGCEEERAAKWRACCRSWTIVVPDGVYYYGARLALSHFFFANPPMCCTYLVTDPLEVGIEDVVLFEPEPKTWRDWLQQVLDENEEQEEEGEEEKPGDQDDQQAAPVPSTGDGHPHAEPDAHASAVAVPAVQAEGRSAVADSVDVGFMVAKQTFMEERCRGDLLLSGRAGAATVAGLDRVLSFMDKFSLICAEKNLNFTTTYDFRQLSMPPISMVKKLAEWGNEPQRMERWNRLNNACKVVVGGGFAYVLSKSILNTYFYACPPVCRTYILTDPDEPEEGAFFFDPAPKAETESAQVPSAVEKPLEERVQKLGQASQYVEPDDAFHADARLCANLRNTRSGSEP